MKVIICETREDMSAKGGDIFAERIAAKPDIVLGLATGSTPEGLYADIAKRNAAGEIDCSKVRTFNLDEYLGIAPDHDQSYRDFMNRKLFDNINIDKANTRVLNGLADDPAAECTKFEDEIKAAGGIDLQLLGIGSNGHIAFNEPGSAKDSRTRVVDLTPSTIDDNARFFASADEVPKQALSMGNGAILEAKEIVMLANGANKAKAVAAALEGPESEDCPASLLQAHDNVTVILDTEAAAELQKTY